MEKIDILIKNYLFKELKNVENWLRPIVLAHNNTTKIFRYLEITPNGFNRFFRICFWGSNRILRFTFSNFPINYVIIKYYEEYRSAKYYKFELNCDLLKKSDNIKKLIKDIFIDYFKSNGWFYE